MPCEKITLPGRDGKPVTGIVCYSRGRRSQKKCFYCGELEDYQCDGAIEKKAGKYKTCDRSMCRSCTVRGAGETDWCKDHRSKIVPGTISIGNIRTTTDGIYVGRKVSSTGLAGSPLGNPFKLSSNFAVANNTDSQKEEREEVLVNYKKWLWADIKAKGAAFQELLRIRNLVTSGVSVKLLCWCHPNSCHADIVKAALIWLLKQNGIIYQEKEDGKKEE